MNGVTKETTSKVILDDDFDLDFEIVDDGNKKTKNAGTIASRTLNGIAEDIAAMTDGQDIS